MKKRIAAGIALVLLTGIAISAHAGLSEDKNGVLHCSGKSSCNSLKAACENGKATYEPTGPTTGTCTVGSSSAALLLPAVQKVQAAAPSRSPSANARQFKALAQRHKPSSPQQERLVRQYMTLPASQRAAFKARHPEVSKAIWDYAPYAVCFYASVAGGADVVEAGDDCHDKWVN